MTKHEVTTYSFAELSDDAKEKAIEKFRDTNVDYNDWYEFVYDDAKTAGSLLGIEIERIYFSGFWSQGDGAMFEGRYEYCKGALKAIKDEYPTDTELHSIAENLQKIQRRYFYGLDIRTEHRGHYYHENTMHVTTFDRDGREIEIDAMDDTLRDFCRWIYNRLETEYEHLTSNEVVKETIEANEYEFMENGEQY